MPLGQPARRWAVALAVVGWLGPAGVSGAAKVYLDINAPALRPIPAAVPELKRVSGAAGNAHRVIAEALRWDLGFSGLFDVLDPAAYLEDPQQAPVEPTPAGFADWFAVGAELVVKGQVDLQNGEIVVDLAAYDVLKRRRLVARQYRALPEAARAVAHRFANTLLEEFTGAPGPFGTRVAYVVRNGPGKELALVDMDGHAPVRLTQAGSLSITPSWSRDGRYLYYVSYLLGEADLYLLDLKTGRNWVVSRNPGVDLGGRDSPDGSELLVVLSDRGNTDIYRMRKSDRSLVRLTRDRAIDVAPTWSPDGKWIAFVSDRMGNPHLFVMDRHGREVRRITFSGTHNGDPDWSPKGDWIAFTGKDSNGTFQVFLVDPEGRRIRQLTYGPYDTYDPSWSPDGRFLAVTSRREGGEAVYVVRVGSNDFRRITPDGERASQPAWEPAHP